MKTPHSFRPEAFGTLHELQSDAQRPGEKILLVACCDHGTAPCHLSIADPRRPNVVQNMAATVPAAGAAVGWTTLASIEYAVAFGNVRHIVVCGHRQCRIIAHWRAARQNGERAADLGEELQSIWSALDKVAAGLPGGGQEAVVREHTLRQIDNLLSHEFIRQRVEDARVRLHAWVVDEKSAKVKAYDPAAREFTTRCELRETVAPSCRRS